MYDVLWFSNSAYMRTGYGRVTKDVVGRLIKRGYNIAVVGMQTYGAVMNYEDIPHLPMLLDAFGRDVIPVYLDKFEPRLFITLFDVWTTPWLPDLFVDRSTMLYIQTPIDHDRVPPLVEHILKKSGVAGVISFSKYGEKKLREVGINSIYIPHGVDINVFKPVDKKKAKRAINFDEDLFIFGHVGANKGDRKNQGGVLHAYKIFLDNNPDARKDTRLYLFTDPLGVERGYNIPLIAQELGIEDNVSYPTRYVALLGGDDILLNVYNAMDVHILISQSEGFGLTILESMACGVPQIVTDFTSMPELAGGCGELVRVASYKYTPLGAHYAVPDVYDAAEKMAKLYNDDSLREKYSKKAVEKAREYDYERIVREYWVPFIDRALGIGKASAEEELRKEIERLRRELEELKRGQKRARRRAKNK